MYDYKCLECKDIQEVFRTMNGGHPVCGHCNSIMQQVFLKAPPVQFKGSGFYSTDYAETNYDQMSPGQRDSHDQKIADAYDNEKEAEDKAFRQKIRDDLR